MQFDEPLMKRISLEEEAQLHLLTSCMEVGSNKRISNGTHLKSGECCRLYDEVGLWPEEKIIGL